MMGCLWGSFPKRLHSPNAARNERAFTAVSLPEMPLLDPLVSQRAVTDLDDAARQVRQLPRAHLASRYLLVELLTGLLFLGCWLALGSPAKPLSTLPLALVFCVFTAGLVVATFIDFEHFIIPG